MNKQLVRVWNVNTNGRTIRAATIEQGPKQESMCEGCPAPCCKGIFQPILNQEEFLSKKFKTIFIPVPDWLKERVPRADYLIVLATGNRGCCPYHDLTTNKCTIWPNCPKSCLAYDCRGDTRPEIKEFVKQREKEWQQR